MSSFSFNLLLKNIYSIFMLCKKTITDREQHCQIIIVNPCMLKKNILTN